MSDLQAIIMAAGLGTRMKSRTAKVLHRAAGRPLIDYVVDLAIEISDRGAREHAGGVGDILRRPRRDDFGGIRAVTQCENDQHAYEHVSMASRNVNSLEHSISAWVC